MATDLHHGDVLLKLKDKEFCYNEWKPVVYEMVKDVLEGPKEEWPSFIKAIRAAMESLKPEDQLAVASLLVDTIWMLDLQLELDAEPTRKTILGNFVLSLLEQSIVPVALAKERLEPELLESSKTITSAQIFVRKQTRMNTVRLYKQQKFQLLREEPEGFSKLIQLLYEEKQDVDWLGERVIGLIGTFDLDPIRVLDLVIERAALDGGDHMIRVVKNMAFPEKTLASLMIFKLRDEERVGIERLLRVLALFIREKMVSIETVYSSVGPSDAICMEQIQSVLSSIKSFNFKSIPTSQLPDAEKAADPTAVTMTKLGYTDMGAVVRGFGLPKGNGKAGLLACLLEVGAEDDAKWMLERIPLFPAASPDISKSICRHVHCLLDAGSTLEDIQEWMPLITPFLSTDPLLFARLCRLLAQIDPSDGLYVKMLSQVLMPAFSLCTANPCLSHELWAVLSRLPESQRYALYDHDRQSSKSSHPALLLARAAALHDLRRVMRRLAKENVRQLGRLIGKILCANPTALFPVLLEQIQSYDNLIEPLIEALRYLTPFGQDTLIYSIREVLAGDRDRLDGSSLASWLQNLSNFTGQLLRRHSTISPLPLLHHCLHRLQSDHDTLDLVILTELMRRMAGMYSDANLAEEEMLVEAAGGPLLRERVRSRQPVDHSLTKRSSQRLLHALVTPLGDGYLAIELWMLLAKFAVSAIFSTDIGHPKLLSWLTDHCHDLFSQFTRLLCQSGTELLPHQALPPIEQLLASGIQPDYAWHMRRSWDRAYNQTNALSVESLWSLDLADVWVPEDVYKAEIALCSPEEAVQLSAELEERQKHLKSVLQVLVDGKETMLRYTAEELTCAILLPRARFSSADSLLASHLLPILHSIGPSRLSTLTCHDLLLSSPTIFALTEREAHCYGRFLGEVLGQLHAWHGDKEAFERESRGAEGNLPGFYQRWTVIATAANDGKAESPAAATDGDKDMVDSVLEVADGEKNDTANDMVTEPAVAEPTHLSHVDFCHALYKWHLKLYRSISASLLSPDYQHRRNALLILSRLSTSRHFPALRKVGTSLQKALTQIRDEESSGGREDLKLLAVRCLAMLQGMEACWVAEDRFHHVEKPLLEVVDSPLVKRSRPESPLESDSVKLETKIKKMHIDDSDGDKRSSRNGDKRSGDKDKEDVRSPDQIPSKSPEEAERELRRKLEERKAAASQQSTSSPSSGSRDQRDPSQRDRSSRDRDRERERDKERERAREHERQREQERQREADRQREIQREMDRQREQERQREIERQREQERRNPPSRSRDYRDSQRDQRPSYPRRR